MKYLIVLLLLFPTQLIIAQSNSCSSATVIGISSDCTSPTNGTTTGATQTIAGCTGNADDDVWYQFTATSTGVKIQVTPSAGMDAVVQLFSGNCGNLTSLNCKDGTLSGETEIINYQNLTIGQVYRIRIYHYGTGAGTGTFTICLTDLPPPPANNLCGTSINLPVNSSCTFTSGTTDGATQSFVGCAGIADDDVWYEFTATNSVQTVTVAPIDNLDIVFQVYSGACSNLTSISCVDNNLTGLSETTEIVGLIPGQTYRIRVYDYYEGTTGDFNICVTGEPTPTPTNDEPCDAILLPEVTSACQYGNFTTIGATASTGAPTPSSCIGGSGAAIGGFSTSTQDVWFKVVVPASGQLNVSPQPNLGTGAITDGVMALYSGTCGSLTQIQCADDNNFPGTGNDLLPLISASGLTPGDTLWLRYWGFGTSSGTFGICATTATNDDCINALYICDINGYSASTSGAYTADRPGNMHGNNEDINGTNLPDGTDSGGIFGQGGPWGTGSDSIDVLINNNSWIKFTASSAVATLTVDIYDCWIGNYPSGGIQMQVFEGTNCSNFVPVSNFEESSTGFVITAINLTVGNDYYLMVDGFAGDICNYTITAESGIQFPDLEEVAPICPGESVTLTAPPGATSYEWQHDGSTGQTVTVTPATTQTYVCEVTGLCDYKQLLDVTVTVNPLPNIQISEGTSTEICSDETATLNVTGASTYSWSTSESGNSISVSPTSQTNYTVNGTDTNGCVNADTISVIVNSLPILSANPTASDADCNASNGALIGATASGTPNLTYSWSDGTNVVGNSANLNNIPAGTYTLTVTDGNSCQDDFGPFSVINPGAPPAPQISVSDLTPCLDGSITLTASSATNGATFNWTIPNAPATTTNPIQINSVAQTNEGNYCVTATFAGCTGPASCETIDVLEDPTLNLSILNDDSTLCLGSSTELSVTGANTYVWNGPTISNQSGNSIQLNNLQQSGAGYYTVVGTDANGCSGEDSLLVDVLPLPTIDITSTNQNDVFCESALITMEATGADSYNWTGPNNFSDQGTPVSIPNASSQNDGIYVVTGTDANGCSNSDSLDLSVITNVPTGIMPDTTLCPGETIQLSAQDGSATYVWIGPVNYYSEEQNPIVTTNAGFENEGEYILSVTDANGCIGIDTMNVEVEESADCIFIPELVTPDKDGKNETWEIRGIEKFKNNKVQIFNRWGNLVYTASPYKNDWDGTVNTGAVIDGKDGKVPVGTYYYILEVNQGDIPPYKGYIEVQY